MGRGVSASRHRLNSIAALYQETPSEPLLNDVAIAALEYLQHEFKLGRMKGTESDDLSFAVGMKLRKCLIAWDATKKCSFSTYFRKVCRNAASDARYEEELTYDSESTRRPIREALELDELVSHAGDLDPDDLLVDLPKGHLGRVIRGYVECYKNGEIPYPHMVARHAGLSFQEAASQMPKVGRWLRERVHP